MNDVNSCPEVFEHMSNHRVVLDQQTLFFNLAGRMTIADVPCELHQVTPHLQQCFLSRNDFDKAPIVQLERIPMIQ